MEQLSVPDERGPEVFRRDRPGASPGMTRERNESARAAGVAALGGTPSAPRSLRYAPGASTLRSGSPSAEESQSCDAHPRGRARFCSLGRGAASRARAKRAHSAACRAAPNRARIPSFVVYPTLCCVAIPPPSGLLRAAACRARARLGWFNLSQTQRYGYSFVKNRIYRIVVRSSATGAFLTTTARCCACCIVCGPRAFAKRPFLTKSSKFVCSCCSYGLAPFEIVVSYCLANVPPVPSVTGTLLPSSLWSRIVWLTFLPSRPSRVRCAPAGALSLAFGSLSCVLRSLRIRSLAILRDSGLPAPLRELRGSRRICSVRLPRPPNLPPV